MLPEVPSFGTQFARGLSSGLNAGVNHASEFAQKLALEKYKTKRMEAIEGLSGQKQVMPKEQFDQQFQEALPQIEKALGRDLTPQDLDQLYSQAQKMQSSSQQEQDPFRKAKQYAAVGEHDLSRVSTEQAKSKEDERKTIASEERKLEREKGETLLDRRDKSRENLLLRQVDYKIAKEAIERNPKEIGGIKNFASEVFGLPQLKTASGAAFSASMKDAFVNTLKNIPGARLNQWVEQQVQSAMARIGQTDEANLSALEIGQFKLDLEEMEDSIIDQLEQEAQEKGRRLGGQDKKELFKRLKPYAEEKQFELAYKLKSLEEKEKGEKFIRKNILNAVPRGTPLTAETAAILKEEAGGDEEKALKGAIKLGYEIPSDALLQNLGYIQ